MTDGGGALPPRRSDAPDADPPFDGIAYGTLLFVPAVGLAVTLGLMNFINPVS